jgi:pyruvate kinase
MLNTKNGKKILKTISELETEILLHERKLSALITRTHKVHKESVKNLIHYLTLRSKDLRKLQNDLSEISLSSLSHCESHVFASIANLKHILTLILNQPNHINHKTFIGIKESHALSKNKSEKLFGKTTFKGETKIMVTLPTEASDDLTLITNLCKAGMQIARINTAHDTEEIWDKMIANLNIVSKKLNKKIKVYMDIEGPKLRVKSIGSGNSKTKKDKSNKVYIRLVKNDLVALLNRANIANTEVKASFTIETPEIIKDLKNGDPVWFDDGKMGGYVFNCKGEYVIIKITSAPENGYKLRNEKGIMFPESEININALTKDDIKYLPFIAKKADMVGYSFVQKTADIIELREKLNKLNRKDIGIILKIETKEAFANLPSLLIEAMRSENCGVMIARGDLAVAVGYKRIAEVQEEIMWVAEAAHLPVIWATQVLENLAKKGVATRAEISDAVKSVRSECVMLNKGPFITDVIKTIKDIDKRMAPHEDKKRKYNRQLSIANNFIIANK